MDVRVGLWKRLSTEELMLLNCGVEKTLESPLDCKEIQPVHSKGDQSWVVFGRNDAEAETPVLWPPHAKSWLIGKDPDAERDWGQEEKGTTEGEMAGWHHQLHGCESEWTPGVGDGQGGLVCCDSWGHKDSDMTERLNWTEQQQRDSLALLLLSLQLSHTPSPTLPTQDTSKRPEDPRPKCAQTASHCLTESVKILYPARAAAASFSKESLHVFLFKAIILRVKTKNLIWNTV